MASVRETTSPHEILRRLAQAMPLDELPSHMQAEIERLASGDSPPARWKNLGHGQIESRAWLEWKGRQAVKELERSAERKRVKRIQVADRDGWVCGICRKPIQGLGDLDIDHVYPLALGGNSETSNLQASHSWCNRSKGARV